MPTAAEQFWLTFAGVVLSPFLAVYVQRLLDDLRDKRRRRERVFHTLMSTRATRVSPDHVVALNQIDIEWYGGRWFGMSGRTRVEDEVLTAWKTYLDHLNQPTDKSPEKLAVWASRSDDLFADLLFVMARSLGYKFDRVHLKRSVYSPVAHGTLEQEQQIIRRGMVEWLVGKRAVRVEFAPPQPAATSNGASSRA